MMAASQPSPDADRDPDNEQSSTFGISTGLSNKLVKDEPGSEVVLFAETIREISDPAFPGIRKFKDLLGIIAVHESAHEFGADTSRVASWHPPTMAGLSRKVPLPRLSVQQHCDASCCITVLVSPRGHEPIGKGHTKWHIYLELDSLLFFSWLALPGHVNAAEPPAWDLRVSVSDLQPRAGFPVTARIELVNISKRGQRVWHASTIESFRLSVSYDSGKTFEKIWRYRDIHAAGEDVLRPGASVADTVVVFTEMRGNDTGGEKLVCGREGKVFHYEPGSIRD